MREDRPRNGAMIAGVQHVAGFVRSRGPRGSKFRLKSDEVHPVSGAGVHRLDALGVLSILNWTMSLIVTAEDVRLP